MAFEKINSIWSLPMYLSLVLQGGELSLVTLIVSTFLRCNLSSLQLSVNTLVSVCSLGRSATADPLFHFTQCSAPPSADTSGPRKQRVRICSSLQEMGDTEKGLRTHACQIFFSHCHKVIRGCDVPLASVINKQMIKPWFRNFMAFQGSPSSLPNVT